MNVLSLYIFPIKQYEERKFKSHLMFHVMIHIRGCHSTNFETKWTQQVLSVLMGWSKVSFYIRKYWWSKLANLEIKFKLNIKFYNLHIIYITLAVTYHWFRKTFCTRDILKHRFYSSLQIDHPLCWLKFLSTDPTYSFFRLSQRRYIFMLLS